MIYGKIKVTVPDFGDLICTKDCRPHRAYHTIEPKLIET